MRIIAVRHGQTEGNVQKVIQSRTGGKLTKVGISQAKQVADKLKDYKFDYIYCSTLDRCKETLGYIMEFHPGENVIYSDKLTELDKGEIEGKQWDALPEYFYSEVYLDRRIPGGESWIDLHTRINIFLNEIYQQDALALIVTHDGPLKVINAILREVPLARAIRISYKNASLYELEMNTKTIDKVLV